MTSFTIPFPPSTNALFTGRRFKTKAYKLWRETAGWTIKIQRPAPLPPGDVTVAISLPHCFRLGDIDNRIKAVLDTIVDVGVLADDRHVVDLRIRWERGTEECRVQIKPA